MIKNSHTKASFLIKEFMEEFPEECEGLSYEEITEILTMPWIYFEKIMQSGVVSEMRFKYLGSFRVYEGRKKHYIKKAEKDYKGGYISEEQLELEKERLK